MNDWRMDVRRLRLLAGLARLGSMRAVAEETGVTTSTVSQQIAALAREAGTPLVEPVGRNIRLTPAGQRLARHATTILAAVEAARLDLDPDAEPAGVVAVAGFATAVRRSLLPVVEELATSHPGVHVLIGEYEPIEAIDLLLRDDVDLALVYDYSLAPLSLPGEVVATHLWDVEWGLGVPAGSVAADGHVDVELASYADTSWIVNSRNTADEEVVRTLAALAGFTPRITHRIDSLELVEDLVVAGRGVGLLPLARTANPGIRVLPLAPPGALLRAYAAVRRGRDGWPPLRLVLDRVADTPADIPGPKRRSG
jgi:DNA-binding transcriptional LysR family regulator